MKYLLSLFVILFGLNLSSASAEEIEQNIPATHLFVPVGYDDNDQVDVVIEGYLPDSCHKLGWVEVAKDIENKTIDMKVNVWKIGEECLEIQVPFTHTVRLGRFPEGSYQVRMRSQDLTRKLAISRSTKGLPDEFLYAPVDSARVASLLPKPGSIAVIEGRLTNSCLKVKELKVLNHEETVEVLPLMEMTKVDPQGEPCRKMERTFVATAPMPELKVGRHLLHVRSLNGQSVNAAFSKE